MLPLAVRVVVVLSLLHMDPMGMGCFLQLTTSLSVMRTPSVVGTIICCTQSWLQSLANQMQTGYEIGCMLKNMPTNVTLHQQNADYQKC